MADTHCPALESVLFYRSSELGGGIVRLRFSIRAYALAVVYIASITTLYKIGVWVIRPYHP